MHVWFVCCDFSRKRNVLIGSKQFRFALCPVLPARCFGAHSSSSSARSLSAAWIWAMARRELANGCNGRPRTMHGLRCVSSIANVSPLAHIRST
uniref:Uncharacterized protein n=1 Tax=Setaria viridis TaxID=4556 RepID=A0A4U6UPH9_SETVI|nr:hypothetical protein SEVIR_5G428266v2 [Setaria viridis]